MQTLALIRHSREWLDWQGITITDGGPVLPDAVRALHGDGLLAGHPEQLAARCDALIVWGFPEAPEWLSRISCRIISASHGDGLMEWNQNQLAAIRPFASLTVAVSDVAARGLSEMPSCPIAVIPNGIDLSRIESGRSRTELRADLDYGPDDKLIGYIGRLSPEKNPLALARAMPHLRNNHHGLYIGTGLNAEHWITEACRLAPTRCRFLGKMDHVGDILQALDCLLLASPAEGSALVLLEAAAAGCPIVATSVGSLPQLQAEVAAPVYSPVAHDDPGEAIAAAIERCLQHASTPLGAMERALLSQHVIRNYSARRMAWRWSQVVTDLVQQRKAA